MKVIVQQVKAACVTIEETGARHCIEQGVILYVCFEAGDIDFSQEKITAFLSSLRKMKMMSLGNEKIDRTLDDVGGSLLVISNFSLAGRMSKGTKVDFSRSAAYDEAKSMYDDLLQELETAGFQYESGEFGAKMAIESTVYGPLNYILEY